MIGGQSFENKLQKSKNLDDSYRGPSFRVRFTVLEITDVVVIFVFFYFIFLWCLVNSASIPGKHLYRGPKGEQGRITNRCGAGSVDGYTGRKFTACLSGVFLRKKRSATPPPLNGPRCFDKLEFYDIRVLPIPSYLLFA